MRILLFSHSNQPGGAQNVLFSLHHGLAEKGHEAYIVPKNGTPSTGADVAISNTITIENGWFWAREKGVPHIWYVHEFERDGQLTPTGNRVVISQAIEDECGGELIYTGIPVADEPYRSPENVVITAGGICRRKGQMTLLMAAALVPDARFESVGGPWERDYVDQIRSERKRLNVAPDRFVMHGFTRDMDSFYKQGRIFASSPEREPFGLSILEAMAHGIPVVTTRSGGPEEIVVEGETGFLVPVGDHEAMADRINFLLRNPEEVLRMGQAGYERVKKHFRYEDFIDQWDGYIREVA